MAFAPEPGAYLVSDAAGLHSLDARCVQLTPTSVRCPRVAATVVRLGDANDRFTGADADDAVGSAGAART